LKLLTAHQPKDSISDIIKMVKDLHVDTAMGILKDHEALSKILAKAGERNLFLIFDQFLLKGRNNIEDRMVMDGFSPFVENFRFKNWMEYAYGEFSTARFADRNIRAQYFGEQLVQRLNAEKSPELRFQLAHAYADAYGLQDFKKLGLPADLQKAVEPSRLTKFCRRLLPGK
jgi:hypothetical protein